MGFLGKPAVSAGLGRMNTAGAAGGLGAKSAMSGLQSVGARWGVPDAMRSQMNRGSVPEPAQTGVAQYRKLSGAQYGSAGSAPGAAQQAIQGVQQFRGAPVPQPPMYGGPAPAPRPVDPGFDIGPQPNPIQPGWGKGPNPYGMSPEQIELIRARGPIDMSQIAPGGGRDFGMEWMDDPVEVARRRAEYDKLRYPLRNSTDIPTPRVPGPDPDPRYSLPPQPIRWDIPTPRVPGPDPDPRYSQPPMPGKQPSYGPTPTKGLPAQPNGQSNWY